MRPASALPARQARQVQELVSNAVRQAYPRSARAPEATAASLPVPVVLATKQYRSLPARGAAQDDAIRNPYLGTAPHAHPPPPVPPAVPGQVGNKFSRPSGNRTVNR